MNDMGRLLCNAWATVQVGSRILFLVKWGTYPWKWRSCTFKADNGNMCKHVRFGIFHYCVTWWESEEDHEQYFREQGQYE